MIEVSPDHRWLASIDGSDQIKLWNYATGKETYQLLAHEKAVNSIDFHPSQNILASGSNDGTIRLWDEKGRLTTTIETGGEVRSVHFSVSGDSIFSSSNGSEIKIWNTASGQPTSVAESNLGEISALAILHEHGLLAAGSPKGKLSILHLKKKKPDRIIRISDHRIVNISFSAGMGRIIVGTDGGELISIDINSNEVSKTNAFTIRNHQVVAYDDFVFACGRDNEDNLKQFRLSDLTTLSGEVRLDADKKSEAFRFGIRALHRSSDTTLLIADYDQNIREWNIKGQKWEPRIFRGTAAPIYDLALSPDHTQLGIASGHEAIKIIDLTGTTGDLALKGSSGGSRAVEFHPVNPVAATYGMDETINVTNLLSGKTIFSLKAKGEYNSTPVTFDPTGNYILRKSSQKHFDFYDFKKNAPKKLKVKDGLDFEFSPNGRKLLFKTRNGLSIYDPIDLKEVKALPISDIQDFSIAGSGAIAVLLKDDRTIHFYNDDFSKKAEIKLTEEASSDKIYWTPTQDHLIGIRNTQIKGESQADFTIKLINPDNGELVRKLPGHSGFVTSIVFLKDHFLLTSSVDGLIKLWDLAEDTRYFLGAIIPLKGEEYVVTTPEGHFDATSGAMNQLHYVKYGNVIALDQLKSEYYEPNLLSKLLEYNEEPVKGVADLSGLKPFPELAIEHPLKNDGKLGISLNNNGGGIGRVVILINGKEVSGDVRNITNQPEPSSLEIDYDIADHPFLYEDRVSKITVKAYNTDGTISSEEKSIYVFGEEKSSEKPELFALVVGTSDYKGENLDLKYAAKDATDFADAISLSASQYVGAENTHVILLTTDQDTSRWPTKNHIRQAFERFSKKASAKDVLIVYLAGHGVNQSGEDGDFYYLTSDAENGDMRNTVTRKTAAVSSLEFTEYIKSVPALKQLLIIDACHSGRLASSLATSRSAISSTHIRSLERMKDRTGLFVLAGSAADAVSYETTLFDQGLLTYSLLFGMKGAALRDDEFIDVLQLFQFAANNVPELAEDIGGIQKPEIRLPVEGKSFDIGRLTSQDREKIVIKAPKPVYVHSRFQDESAIFDRLHVAERLDSRLMEISRKKDAKIVFVDDKSFSGASTIHGRYFETEGLLKAKVTVVKQHEITRVFEVEAVNARLLSERIATKILTENPENKMQ